MTGWADASPAAAEAIHSVFATVLISIVPTVGGALTGIAAVEVDAGGDDPFGEGRSVLQRGFEVRKVDVPDKPKNGSAVNVVESDGAGGFVVSEELRLIEVDESRSAGAWTLMVESK